MELEGVVEKIIFRNEDNGYTVAKFFTEEESITIVGSCLFMKESHNYRITGDFTYHQKFGQQFAFDTIEAHLPDTKKGLIKYLSSGLIPYIGEKMATRIVDQFGDESFTVIEKSPERLLNVEGIGPKKFKKIKEALEEHQSVQKLMMALSDYDISTNLAIKIYGKYGNEAFHIIQDNPYLLVEDIPGIGFKTADRIASSMGFEKDSPFRIQAGLKYILSRSASEGHCYLPLEELTQQGEGLLGIGIDRLENSLQSIALDENFFVERREEDINCYYAPYLRGENFVAGKLNELNISFSPDGDIVQRIKEIEERREISLAKKQREAVIKSVEKGVFVMTGGPGTGKTTTLKVMIDLFESMDKKIKLCAPTGRAAKRMEETTNRRAFTIHKLLEIQFIEDHHLPYEEVNLDCDVVIVDEMSMVDILLMETLLRSIKKGMHLILVGDNNQLPSVGAGNVLGDIIQSEIFSQVHLTDIFRQSKESMIIENAHLIHEGRNPILNRGDFFMIQEQGEYKALEIIKDLVTRRLPQYYNLEKEDIQILSPMKKGILGVEHLNEVLQEVLNQQTKEIKLGKRKFKLRDRVMQIRNNYDLECRVENEFYVEESKGVFNGDMGIITEIDSEESSLEVTFEGARKVKYTREILDELMLCYATTIHKSQGSEFPVVVIPMTWAPPMLLTRNLIYTAITRASKLVVLVGQSRFLKQMIQNNHMERRYSHLKEKLVEIHDQSLS